ncbi:MAG: hypothetical protein JXR95_03690 [Deltaproteobacteria bacterium]|nr:hypothetical protein [Deltaproteobacteria bacterium]
MKHLLLSLMSAILVLFNFSSPSFALEGRMGPMELKTGTVIIGGTISGDYVRVTPESGDSLSGSMISIAPAGGYFITENVALSGSVEILVPSGDAFSHLGKSYAISAGARYYHQFDRFYIYGGIEGGFLNISSGSDNTSNNTLKIDERNYKADRMIVSSSYDVSGTLISFPFGLIFPLSSHIALDVGIKINYFIDDDDNRYLDINLGYFGIQSYF